jgi:hypothetical protein
MDQILLGPFRIFPKIRGDIHEWMFITYVNDSGNKPFTEKIFTGVVDTGDKTVLF